MKKINTKKIIYITIIICIIIGYYLLRDKEEYVENLNVESIYEENHQEENLSKENNIEEKNKIIIHISGAIQNQGIYELEEGSRIADSIQIAGGLKEEANIKNINLAYVLKDGMKIYIPSINENINEIQDNTNEYISRDSTNTEDNENNEKNKEIININTATQTELETLPGIGPSIALNIINYRKEHGKFNSIEDLKNVSGIGNNKYSKIKDLIKI